MPESLASNANAPLRWDVFCRVIDNFGDIGVCWRLCADLAARGHTIRLWVDDASSLAWMAPGALQGRWPGVQVLDWAQSSDTAFVSSLVPADIWIEGFGCEIAPEFIAAHAYYSRAGGINDSQLPVWINLEYLSAESYVERSHGLPSPVMHGPARGWTKHFFYPGFTRLTGGLLREPELMAQRLAFDQGDTRALWLANQGIDWAGERLVSLFCYEPAALTNLLAQLATLPGPTHLLVTAGRASVAVRAALAQSLIPLPNESTGTLDRARQGLRVSYLEPMAQSDFDRLLWACDLNCVRGEDSVVRAIWAGKPLLWQIYPQHDAAHVAKLDAFLDALGACTSLRAVHHLWNDTRGAKPTTPLPLTDLNEWAQNVLSTRQGLLEMDDLTTQLLQFAQKKR
ncbi:MAG: elongation factor P maturation arginine rhamnosyltransferase EarP [Burkholderiales bacterium]|nr:elongation factor P maturation arginine rhamnosyltransferase EarP [Burkholderiales bacterium]